MDDYPERIVAELALHRLAKEKSACLSRMSDLSRSIGDLPHVHEDMLSSSEISAIELASTTFEKKSATLNSFMLTAVSIWGVVTLGLAVWVWFSTSGFFSVIGALITVGLGSFAVGSVLMALVGGLSTLVAGNPEKHLRDARGKIDRHQTAVRRRGYVAQLESAKSELAAVEAEINRNLEIVRKA